MKELYIYGAGKHTLRLLESNVLATVTICGIIDDYTLGQLHGIPIIRKEKVRLNSDTYLLLSSDHYENVLFEQSQKLCPKAKILRIYGDIS